jgi:hypothetical protein
MIKDIETNDTNIQKEGQKSEIYKNELIQESPNQSERK